jgi:hypothetical protein
MQGDHVLCDLLTKTNAGVTTLGDDVGQCIVEDNCHVYVRIFQQQLREGRPQDGVGRMFDCRNTDIAGRLLTQFA